MVKQMNTGYPLVPGTRLAPDTPVYVGDSNHTVFVRQDNGGELVELEDYAGDSLPPTSRSNLKLAEPPDDPPPGKPN